MAWAAWIKSLSRVYDPSFYYGLGRLQTSDQPELLQQTGTVDQPCQNPMPMDNSSQQQAQAIIDTLAFMPFEQCQPITRDFATFPARPGLYAIRHRLHGLLYIGKTKSLRGRFSGGHKAFLWAWLDQYDNSDIRIAIYLLSAWRSPALLSELEAIILRATEPPYNVQIPPEG